MSKGSGNTREGKLISHSISEPKKTIYSSWANELLHKGYEVHFLSNGAYWAMKGNTHGEHEQEAVKILAESGIVSSLDEEGKLSIRYNRQKYTLPSPDGTLNNSHTFEISALNTLSNNPALKVSEAIEHSFKAFKQDNSKSVQADIAITIDRTGLFHRSDIDNGVKIFRDSRNRGAYKSNPLLYIHIDEKNRRAWARKV